MLATNISLGIGSFAVMWALFCMGWEALERRIWQFRVRGDHAKANWSKRIPSTVYAVVICSVVGMCIMTISIDPSTLVPESGTTLIDISYSIAIGYFAFDMTATLWWKPPWWCASAVVNIFLMMPYFLNQFISPNQAGQYVFLLLLLFDAVTIPLNAVATLSDLGQQGTKFHLFAQVAVYVSWFCFRIMLPFYVLFLLWTRVICNYVEEESGVIPAVIIVPIVTIIFIHRFCFVLTPGLYKRLRYGSKIEPESSATLPIAASSASTPATTYLNPDPAGGSTAYHPLDVPRETPARPTSLAESGGNAANDGTKCWNTKEGVVLLASSSRDLKKGLLTPASSRSP